MLTALEVACALSGYGHVELHHVEEALGTSALRYGRDDHYDVVSAFIKSMRGSDPDAAVYWLARMLEAGEDARFIARRMVIFASEDVGLADSGALTVAVAAAHALEHVGLPEAQLNLSQAAIYLATAPKIEPIARWRSGTRAPRSATARSARCRRICATRTTRPRPVDRPRRRATSILTTIAGPSSSSSTCPTSSSAVAGTNPSQHGDEPEISSADEDATDGGVAS